MLKILLGPITDIAKTYLGNRAEEKAAKHQAKMNVIQNDADWESKMAAASASSWKDEFWTIVLAVPIFMDDMSVVTRVEASFLALSELPEWYQYLLFIAISSSFGIKGVSKIMELRK